MNKFENEFVALVCPQCGGKVEIEEGTYEDWFIEVDDTTVIFSDRSVESEIKCLHCGQQFINKTKINKYRNNGGVYIGGNVRVGGDFVGGDKIIANVSANNRGVVIGKNAKSTIVITGSKNYTG